MRAASAGLSRFCGSQTSTARREKWLGAMSAPTHEEPHDAAHGTSSSASHVDCVRMKECAREIDEPGKRCGWMRERHGPTCAHSHRRARWSSFCLKSSCELFVSACQSSCAGGFSACLRHCVSVQVLLVWPHPQARREFVLTTRSRYTVGERVLQSCVHFFRGIIGKASYLKSVSGDVVSRLHVRVRVNLEDERVTQNAVKPTL